MAGWPLTRHDGQALATAESSVAGDSKCIEPPGFGDRLLCSWAGIRGSCGYFVCGSDC